MRVAWLSVEIQRIEECIGEWSARVPEGAPMWHGVSVMMREKHKVEQELWALAASRACNDPPPISFWADLVARFKRRRPVLSR